MHEIFIDRDHHFPYGIPATQLILNTLFAHLSLPQPDEDKDIVTLNQMGYMTTLFDVITTEFIDFAAQCQLPVLDIGAAYGIASIAALERGATVISNDMDERHLVLLRKFTPSQYWQHLYLKVGQFPNQLDFPSHSISAILLRKMIHFLHPTEIEVGLDKLKQWLLPGGRIFIVTMSPFHECFKSFLPRYEQRWHNGIQWPGQINKCTKYLTRYRGNIPEYLHLMDERPLSQALNKKGFTILKTTLFAYDDYTAEPDSPHQASFLGVIAEKC